VTVDDDRSSVLVIRVWLEDGADGFQARLTTLGPPWEQGSGDDAAAALAASPAAVSDAVRAWLLSFVGSTARPGWSRPATDRGRDGGVTGG
jgi:hypothetical protein